MRTGLMLIAALALAAPAMAEPAGPPAPKFLPTLPGNRAEVWRPNKPANSFVRGLHAGADVAFTGGLLGTGIWSAQEYRGVWGRCDERGWSCKDQGLNQVIGHSALAQYGTRGAVNTLVALGSVKLRRSDSTFQRVMGWVVPPLLITLQSYTAERDQRRVR